MTFFRAIALVLYLSGVFGAIGAIHDNIKHPGTFMENVAVVVAAAGWPIIYVVSRVNEQLTPDKPKVCP